ncbi:hypothetical protein GEMRC1_009242 [Eukaryota sp. GEM-RC1]
MQFQQQKIFLTMAPTPRHRGSRSSSPSLAKSPKKKSSKMRLTWSSVAIGFVALLLISSSVISFYASTKSYEPTSSSTEDVSDME